MLGAVRLVAGGAPGAGDEAGDGRRSPVSASAAADLLIRVEPAALAAFVQSRTGLLDTAAFEARWAELSPAAREDWSRRYVREEALVREARALGLDRDDPLIRRRLVQQMEFVALGDAEAGANVSEAQLEAFYAERLEDYRTAGRLRFSHVFLRDDRGESRAAELLGELNRRRLSDEDALSLGDRFLYQRLYVDRSIDEVASHFGPDMTEALRGLTPDPSRWQGPLRSEHGWHLVRLRRSEAPRQPELAEVRGALLADWRRSRREAELEAAVGRLVSKYRVEKGPGLGAGLDLGLSRGRGEGR